jgi:nitroreductase
MILNNLKWRYATKKFDSKKKVTEKELAVLLETLRLSPSSMGLQPWKFIVINDMKLRKQLRGAAWNQPQITDASHLILLCSRRDVTTQYAGEHVNNMAHIQKQNLLKLKGYQLVVNGFLTMMKPADRFVWAQKQVYIALGFLLSACAQMHIDSCPMEGFDRKKVDSILELDKTDYASVAMCPLGYRSREDKHAKETKVRWDKKRVIEYR